MRRSYKKRTGNGIIIIVVLMICAVVSYRKFGLEDESVQAKQTIEKLQNQIKEQDERAADIKNKAAYYKSKKYIEDIARDKLGLVDKDDIIFKAENK